MPNRPTVYIVDDDPLLRESISLLVRSKGFHAIAHASAEEFLETFSLSGAPACLVLDVRLCGMSGLGLQEELVARNIRIPVIVVTGFSTISLAVQAMRAGAIDFLEKPFNFEMLLTTIEHSIDRDAHIRRMQENEIHRCSRMQLLSPREREVMELLVAAKGTKQIAASLGIDAKTVSKHRARGLEKLQADSIVQVARLYSPLFDAEPTRSEVMAGHASLKQ